MIIVKCPYCGYSCDRATEMHDDGRKPEDGDFSMCITCGKFSVFEAKLQEGLRKPTEAETSEIARDADCFNLWQAWRLLDERRRASARRH